MTQLWNAAGRTMVMSNSRLTSRGVDPWMCLRCDFVIALRPPERAHPKGEPAPYVVWTVRGQRRGAAMRGRAAAGDGISARAFIGSETGCNQRN